MKTEQKKKTLPTKEVPYVVENTQSKQSMQEKCVIVIHRVGLFRGIMTV